MFCPFCGIKNTPEQQACFVCSKKLPSLDTDSTPRPRALRTVSRPAEEPARLRDRLLAAVLDLLLIAAVLLVAGAALWSKTTVVRDVSRAIVIACAASAALLIIFGYTWLFADATIGKAFTGIRVVRRERPLSVGKRVGVIALWVATVAGAIWGAFTLIPLR